jgi:hypothetical protein
MILSRVNCALAQRGNCRAVAGQSVKSFRVPYRNSIRHPNTHFTQKFAVSLRWGSDLTYRLPTKLRSLPLKPHTTDDIETQAITSRVDLQAATKKQVGCRENPQGHAKNVDDLKEHARREHDRQVTEGLSLVMAHLRRRNHWSV